MTDLLLLNATNLPWRPIFPYAFVQVSAIARRNGLRVKVMDMLNVPRERWESMLGAMVADHKPRMIGLHIRQGDSVFLDDYYTPGQGPKTTRNYFPIDDNQALVQTLRSVTNAPLIAGGFGFTTHAYGLYDHLRIDYGVQGCPDDVFANFENVVAGENLGSIKSLIHRQDGAPVFNERGFYSPFAGREYNDQIVDEIIRFYGHSTLFGPNPPTIPVEIMRGCPFKCFFCTEPTVKGRDIRVRDLDVVEQELEFLVSKHLRRFWFVCSELDAQGTGYAMKLAERVIKLRERTGGAPIEWSAYSLPRLEEDELRTLQRAGYVGALNDVLSLDDTNLRKCGVPYRSKQAVAFLKAVTKLDREDAASAANAAAAESKVKAGLTQRTPKELASILGLFLGNAHATADTLRTTLRRIEDEGLRENYSMGLPFPATRVFAPGGKPICPTTERGLFTYGPNGTVRDTTFLAPTYYYPDFLIEKLGSPDAVIEFMRYVGETLMSVGHRARKDWSWFLARNTSAEQLTELLRAAGPMPETALALAQSVAREPARRMADLFAPPPLAKPAWNAAAREILEHVMRANADAFVRVQTLLGIDPEWTEYKVIEQLSRRYASHDALLAAVEPNLIERLYVEWLLYANNVQLRSDYAELMFAPLDAANDALLAHRSETPAPSTLSAN
jgi:hypothetical protein